jgi:hypothetical protein
MYMLTSTIVCNKHILICLVCNKHILINMFIPKEIHSVLSSLGIQHLLPQGKICASEVNRVYVSNIVTCVTYSIPLVCLPAKSHNKEKSK